MTRTCISPTAGLFLVLLSALAHADIVNDADPTTMTVIVADTTGAWADLSTIAHLPTVVDLGDALALPEEDQCFTADVPGCWWSLAWIGFAWSGHYIAQDHDRSGFDGIGVFNERL
jgi:hypothetical protein